MDEMEEFLNVFFQECDERLGELQEDLAAIQDGNWDMETLNSAFRAVHSVKGGAGAFGLNDLVEFTHIFETLMDVMRAGKLEPDAKVCNVLLRASDMMSALIEAAQGRGAHDRDTANKLMIELAELAGVEPPAGAKSGAASGDAPAEPADAAAAQDAAEEGVGDDEDEDEDDGADDREVVLNFEPGPDFIRSGHDPLKLIRALKQFGRVKAERIGEHLPLEEVEPLEVNFSWKITLDTAVERAELEAFLEMYTLTADISIDDPAADAAEGSEPPAAAEPAADAPAAAGDAPAETAAADGSAETPTADAPAAAAAASAADAEAPAAAAPAGDDAARPSTRQQGPASAQTQKVSKALRVELSRIDRLVNMVGEIVITQAVLSQRFAEMELHTDIEFGHAVEALSRQTRELQESVMAIRAQPVKSVFARMPRVVRDLCASLGKECKMVLSGEHVEVDSTVIEELSEPLTHMLRNSMDHGVEMPNDRESKGKQRQGTIHLGAEHRGERVRIVIEDDGAGINREKVLSKAVEKGIVPPDQQLSDEEIDMLIFHPGFSTADKITNVSGRGVGMDVVKKKVQSLGGRVSVTSTPGKGSRFAITLPLTLAVLDGMTIGVGQERFIIPLSSVVEAVKVDASNIDHLPNDLRVLRYRGEWLPLISVRETLGLDTAEGSENLVVVVETETEGRVAILVDELLGQRQVVLKSLEANFRRVEGASGATILGDGRVALILDIPALHAMAGGGSTFSQEIA